MAAYPKLVRALQQRRQTMLNRQMTDWQALDWVYALMKLQRNRRLSFASARPA